MVVIHKTVFFHKDKKMLACENLVKKKQKKHWRQARVSAPRTPKLKQFRRYQQSEEAKATS